MPSAGHDQLRQDLHPPLSPHEAHIEADRCYFCHDAPCVTACPTGIDIPLFIRQISTGNLKGSARTIFDENIFGGMCARVCPTETLCEQGCVRNTAEDKPVRIGELQRHATDALMQTGKQPYSRAAATGKSVAVVGAGPAGIACAHRLSMHGHDVVVYDAQHKPGGLNEYGIAAYKTIDDFAQQEIEYILSIGGITLQQGKSLGSDISIAQLKSEHDAVFLGLGLSAVNQLDISGSDLAGIDDAVDFIATLRQTTQLSELAVGRRVLVIGGGMTAIDAAVQSKLLGAEEVTIAYRRSQQQMNASLYEQNLAQTNGVLLREWLSPKVVHGDAGQVTAVEFDCMTEVDGSLKPAGDTRRIECDQVLVAIGQAFAFDNNDELQRQSGRIKVDAEHRTSDAKVWAGGDCVAGSSDLTVAAVQAGKLAAESINASMRG